MADIPTTDEFFGGFDSAASQTVPTADEFFEPSFWDKTKDALSGPVITGKAAIAAPMQIAKNVGAAIGTNEPPPSSPEIDDFFHKTQYGRILSQFGQGFEHAWGEGPLTWANETNQWLKETGTYNDLSKGESSLVKSFNEAFLRPAVTTIVPGVEAAVRGASGAFGGTQGFLLGAAKEFVEPLLPEKGIEGVVGPASRISTDIAAVPEAFAGSPHPFGLAQPPTLGQARNLGVIGDGEAGWKGTKVAEDPKVAQQRYVDAYREWDELRQEQPPSAEGPRPGETTPGSSAIADATAAEPLDVHTVARQIAPQVFEKYDALSTRQDTFRRWIDELGESRKENPRIKELNDEIDAALAKVNGVEDRLTKTAASRIEAARTEVNDLLTKDSSDMTTIRKALIKNDEAMRDMAPDVSAAYREANEYIPQERPSEPIAEAAKESDAPVAEPTKVAEDATPETPSAVPTESVRDNGPANENTVTNIASDVQSKLISAGRPAEEAKAAATIVQSHYEARAARLGMTPEELYASEHAEIVSTDKGRKDAAGKTTLEDGQTTITLMKKADASTFMHETGHQWLDELVRDSENPRSNTDLRNDATAVRKWLGAEDGKPITRSQHEKFARGFERYLMEGRAPSPELARVFLQFREWLKDIYETVTKLKSPITDDIRKVFDNLIVKEPEPTVIAGERARTPNFAERQTAEAERTPPAESAKAAENVRAEADEASRQNFPEIYNELNPGKEPIGETEGSAGKTAETSGNGDASGPGPRDDGTSPPSGGVGAGRDTASAQGGGARETTESPVKATQNFAPTDERLVDKAGNIRIDNLAVPEDVAAAIRQAADENGEFVVARRGVISDAETFDLADALGTDPALLDRRQIGEAFNAEQIIYARKLLIDSATKVRDIAIKAGDVNASDADIVAYAEAKTRHAMIQEQVAGVTAEAGRALRAFRALDGMQEAQEIGSMLEQVSGQTLYQLRREARLVSKLDTPQKVSKMVQDSKKASYGEMFIEYYINAMLSGPMTQIRNIMGNTGTLVVGVVESQIAGISGAIREGITGKAIPDRVQLGEAKARLFALFQSAPESVVAAWKTFKNEEFLESAKTLEQRRFQAIPSKVIEIGKNEIGGEGYKAKIEGIATNQARAEGLTGKAVEERIKEILANPTDEMKAAAEVKTFEIGGRQARVFTRFLGAADEFFKGMATRAEMEAQAWRTATSEGLQGQKFYGRVAQLVENPTDEMIVAADKSAKYQTYQSPLGKSGRAIQQLASSHPIARMIVTFIRTPINIAKYNLERTPLGLAAQEVRDNMAGRNGGAARDTQIARFAVGTAVGVSIIKMVGEGLITDGGPKDPRERAILRATGWEPYSVKIGSGYYSFAWMPLGILMGLYADSVRMHEAYTNNESEKIAALLMASISKNLTNQTWLKGPSDLIEAVSDPDRYGDNYIQGLVAGATVPTGIAWLSRIDDPYLREVHSINEAIKSRLPGISGNLLPRRDVWGEPMLREQPVTDDPVNQRLLAIRYFPSKLERQIRGVELTDQQYDDFARIAGRYSKMRLDTIVASPQIAQAPVAVQVDIIRKAVDNAREQARALMMMQNPSIWQAAVNDKLQMMSNDTPRKGPIKQVEASK